MTDIMIVNLTLPLLPKLRGFILNPYSMEITVNEPKELIKSVASLVDGAKLNGDEAFEYIFKVLQDTTPNDELKHKYSFTQARLDIKNVLDIGLLIQDTIRARCLANTISLPRKKEGLLMVIETIQDQLNILKGEIEKWQ